MRSTLARLASTPGSSSPRPPLYHLQDVAEDQQLLARLVHRLGPAPGAQADTDAQFQVLSAAQVRLQPSSGLVRGAC